MFLLSSAEGGRKTPCGSGYTPQFYFGATDVPASCRSDVLGPGDSAEVELELGHAVALEAGMRFANCPLTTSLKTMREGGRTVGAGVVSRVA